MPLSRQWGQGFRVRGQAETDLAWNLQEEL